MTDPYLFFEQVLRLILYEERPDFLVGGFPGPLPGPDHIDDRLHPQLRQHRQKPPMSYSFLPVR